jgi:hypothetical protein
MSIFYGVGFICLGAVLLRITFVGARRPNPSKWFDGFVYLSLLVIGILTLPMIGLNFLGGYVRSIADEPVNVLALLLSATSVVGTLVYLIPAKHKSIKLKAMRAS